MNKFITTGMEKATALTKVGKLQEATALIQSQLHGWAEVSVGVDANTIEGDFTRLGDAPSQEPNAPKPIQSKSRATTGSSGLGETLRRIAAGGMPDREPLADVGADLPVGARFLSGTYASAQGRRDYRLYIPATKPNRAMPLIVMLHGCTQSPEDFAIGTGMNALAEEFGCLIAYPAQPSGANMQKCWNWYRPEDQRRDVGEPALIAGLTQDIIRDHGGDAQRVYVAGLSAGAAAAVIMADAYPEIFSAVGVHSGLPTGAAQDIPSAFAAMRSGAKGAALHNAVPTIVFHGTADNTVHPDNGRAVITQALTALPGLDRSVKKATSTGGRTYRQIRHDRTDGRSMIEYWEVDGAGHAWSGGQAAGSYTDPKGPNASREMLRFFLQHRRS